jgi:hypothetical protein
MQLGLTATRTAREPWFGIRSHSAGRTLAHIRVIFVTFDPMQGAA